MAAALGVSEAACHRDATGSGGVSAVAASTTVQPSASASVVATPTSSGRVEVAASSIVPVPSASAHAIASAREQAPDNPTIAILRAIGNNPDTLRDLAIAPVDLSQVAQTSCGVSNVNPHELNVGRGTGGVGVVGPTAAIAVSSTGAVGTDDHVIATLKPKLRSCANQALRTDPTMTGTLVLSVLISASGDAAPTVASSTGLNGTVSSCMGAAFRSASFATGSSHTVTVKIVQSHESH